MGRSHARSGKAEKQSYAPAHCTLLYRRQPVEVKVRDPKDAWHRTEDRPTGSNLPAVPPPQSGSIDEGGTDETPTLADNLAALGHSPV